MNITEVCKMTDDNTLIENAILAFLHNYPEHKWVEQYKVLLSKVKALQDGQPSPTKVQGRGRPAKRQRKKETTSSSTSKEEIQTT